MKEFVAELDLWFVCSYGGKYGSGRHLRGAIGVVEAIVPLTSIFRRPGDHGDGSMGRMLQECGSCTELVACLYLWLHMVEDAVFTSFSVVRPVYLMLAHYSH